MRFEQLKADLLDVHKISVGRIRVFVQDVNRTFAAYQIFPDREVEEYKPAFERLQQGLAGLQELLAPYENRDVDVGERTLLFKRVKEYLDGFDIEALARPLA